MRQPHDHGEFGELSGLHVDGTDGKPAGRPARVSSEAERDGDHQQHRDQQNRVRRAAQQIEVDVREEDQHEAGKGSKHRLAKQEMVAVAEHAARVDSARAVDHHDPKGDEPDRRGSHRDVDGTWLDDWLRFRRSCHDRPPRLCTAR